VVGRDAPVALVISQLYIFVLGGDGPVALGWWRSMWSLFYVVDIFIKNLGSYVCFCVCVCACGCFVLFACFVFVFVGGCVCACACVCMPRLCVHALKLNVSSTVLHVTFDFLRI
jgi:hypothetical protein